MILQRSRCFHRWGRRKAIIISCLSLIIGAFKTLVGTGPAGYMLYVTIEFIEALLVTGTYTTCFVLSKFFICKSNVYIYGIEIEYNYNNYNNVQKIIFI